MPGRDNPKGKPESSTAHVTGTPPDDPRPQMSGGAGSAGSSPVVAEPTTSATNAQKAVTKGGPALRLFVDELSKMLYTETTLLEMLRLQAEQAGDADLHDRLEQHRRQTEQQIARLNNAFNELGEQPRPVECHTADAFVQDTDEAVARLGDRLRPPIYAAANIRVEHFELGAYDLLIEMAKKMGLLAIASSLKDSRDEEEAQLMRLMRYSTTIDPRRLNEAA